MAILYRNLSQNSEKLESSLKDYNEWGYDFMRSNKAKLMRDNVDMAKIRKG